ncbi:MAG: translocation/assembly module TamB domain-containing protein, partial [Alphaproteobacteria bacterium]
DWRGRLTAAIGTAASADLTLVVGGTAAHRVAATGTLRPGPLVPGEWREVIGEELRLRAEAILGEDALTIDALELQAAGVSLSGSGRRGADGAIAATLEAAVADLRPVGAAIGQPVAGSARGRFEVTGTEAAPVVAATIDGSGLSLEDVRAAGVTLRATLRRSADATTIDGDGRIIGPEAGADLPPIGDIDWSLAGRVGDDGTVRIDRATVRAASAAIEAAGTLSADGRIAGTLDGRIERAVLAHLGAPVTGMATVRGEARADADGAIEGTFSGTLEQPQGEAALVALTGDRVAWSTRVRQTADGTIRLRDLMVEGRNAVLGGAATIAPDRTIDAEARLSLPRLEVLSGPLGRALAGSATINAAVRGDPARPTGTARIESPAITIDGQRLLKVNGEIGLRADGDAMVAPVTAKAEFEGALVTLAATIRERGPGAIAIDDLRATAAGARVSGRVLLADLMPAEGALRVEAEDLSGLTPFLGTRLGGSGRLDLRLERGARPRVAATARIERLVLPDLTTGGISLDATIDDPFGRAAGTASLDARVITTGGQTIDQLKIDARGSLADGMRTTIAASARRPKPLSLELAARIQREAGAVRATVSAADLRVEKRRITLGKPMRLAWSNGVASFEDVDVRLDDGRVTGSGRLAPDGAAVEIAIARLSLNTIGDMIGVPRLIGRLDGQVAIDTGGPSPNGRIALDARGLRWRGAGRDLPAVGVRLEGRWADGRVKAEAQLRETSDAALKVTADLPLVRRGAPFDLVLPESGALTVRADGRAELARLQRYVPVEGFTMAGRLELALTVDGTVGAPRPGGEARLANARFEEGWSGVVLSNLQAVVVGDGRRFRLESLQAQDGAGGRITATGQADRRSDGWQAEASIELARFRALANDVGTVLASGRLAFRSDARGSRISGEARVDRGEIQIPEKPPAAAVPIRVVEVNKPGNGTIEPPPEPPALPIALAIQLEVPGRLFVRGRGIETEWRGTLRIAGTVAEPAINGRIETVRGHYDLLGRRFRVSRGIISFDGAPTAAGLDVQAVANANEVEATVTVTGSVTSPVLALGSNPPLPQDEVLSRVLFGKGTTQITPGQAVQLAQAAGELAGFGGGSGILDRVRRRLGLDTLDVGGADGTSVTLGRYIADDVFVKVNPNPGQDGANVTVEIEVLPNLTVDTGVGGNGTSVGVKYRLDY